MNICSGNAERVNFICQFLICRHDDTVADYAIAYAVTDYTVADYAVAYAVTDYAVAGYTVTDYAVTAV